MQRLLRILKFSVTAFVLTLPATAQDSTELDALFAGLATADADAARQIEGRIYEIWSQSGSPSMDLLLGRGRDALAEGDTKRAIEHLSALVDHAPDFAEAWNARATAWYQMGLYGPALDDIRQTLTLNPRHFGAMSGLALILEEMGMEENALEVWREVEKISPQREGLAEAVRRLELSVEGRSL